MQDGDDATSWPSEDSSSDCVYTDASEVKKKNDRSILSCLFHISLFLCSQTCSLYTALADYNAVDSNEVTMSEGDTLQLLQVGHQGWWFVRHFAASSTTQQNKDGVDVTSPDRHSIGLPPAHAQNSDLSGDSAVKQRQNRVLSPPMSTGLPTPSPSDPFSPGSEGWVPASYLEPSRRRSLASLHSINSFQSINSCNCVPCNSKTSTTSAIRVTQKFSENLFFTSNMTVSMIFIYRILDYNMVQKYNEDKL